MGTWNLGSSAVFAATMTCLTEVAVPGGSVEAMFEIENLTDEDRHFRLALKLIDCRGLVRLEPERQNILPPYSSAERSFSISVPANISPMFKNCDLTFELSIEDFDTGAFREEDMCVFQIQNPS